MHSRLEAPGIPGNKAAYTSGGLFGGQGSSHFLSIRLGANLPHLLTAVITYTLTLHSLGSGATLGLSPAIASPGAPFIVSLS